MMVGAASLLRIAVLILSLLASSLTAEGQSNKIPKIGVLSLGFPDPPDVCVNATRRGLEEIGYVEGRTHVFEFRWGQDRIDLMPSLAADLVRMKVDILVSSSGPAALIAKESTTSIPIVLASSFYPVELGVVASLAHPGGNVTGVTHFTPELMKKRVQLLKELLPKAGRIAVLRLPGRLQDLVVRDMEQAARELQVQLQTIEVQRAEDVPGAFDAAVKGRAQAIMTTQSPLFWHNRAQIAQLARKNRLPSLSGEPEAAEAGALMFYGPDVMKGCARAAQYIDRILKGAKPADLPIEQPTNIKMIINKKTAQALGLTIPPALLLRADQVIE